MEDGMAHGGCLIVLADGDAEIPTIEELRAAAARVAEAQPGAEVWLFGSLAQGRARRGSDVDLAVVLPDSVGDARSAQPALRRVIGPMRSGLDLVVYRRSNFDSLAHDAPASLAATIRREGVRLMP